MSVDTRSKKLEARHPADSLIDVAAIRRQLEQDAITLASYGPPEPIPEPEPSGDPESTRSAASWWRTIEN